MKDKRSLEINKICRSLERKYQNPRHGNKINSLDELVYIILSTRTQERAFKNAYKSLKNHFVSWSKIKYKDWDKMVQILKPCGLARIKASQIIAIFKLLRQNKGSVSLAFLKKMSTQEAEDFLIKLPGVSKKVAKCVLMYSLCRPVLPVDVHVHRISSRIGLFVKKRPDTSQDMIENAIPPLLRYGYHVNCIAHGRTVCFPNNPDCCNCCIQNYCQTFKIGLNNAR
jgi:endonuclease III